MAKKRGPVDYLEQMASNEFKFKEVVKQMRPDIFVLMDLIDSTGINSYVIFHVIKHLNNIILGTKYGTVEVSVKNGVVSFIRGEEETKLDEPLRK